jgi:hypothetical protein
MTRSRSLVLAACLLALPCVVHAVSDDNNATATVLEPLAVTGVRDLAFGNVFPGVNVTVDKADATSGKWTITGEATGEVTLDFTTLPASLVKGGDTLPIVYSATDAGRNTVDNPATATAFDPSVQETAVLSAVGGELWVWLGGQVQPASDQAAGVYTATVTLDVNYTGN